MSDQKPISKMVPFFTHTGLRKKHVSGLAFNTRTAKCGKPTEAECRANASCAEQNGLCGAECSLCETEYSLCKAECSLWKECGLCAECSLLPVEQRCAEGGAVVVIRLVFHSRCVFVFLLGDAPKQTRAPSRQRDWRRRPAPDKIGPIDCGARANVTMHTTIHHEPQQWKRNRLLHSVSIPLSIPCWFPYNNNGCPLHSVTC